MSAVEAHKQTLGQGIIEGQPMVGAKSGGGSSTTGHFTPQLMMSS